jgi:hypothetical protein
MATHAQRFLIVNGEFLNGEFLNGEWFPRGVFFKNGITRQPKRL